MRILKVSQTYYPFLEKGGPAIKVRAIARILAQRGHQVTVLAADLGLREKEGQSLGITRGRWGAEIREERVEAIYFPSRLRYRALTLNAGVFRFCKDRLADFDLVHVYGLYDLLGPAVARFCRRQGLPYVVEPLGMVRAIDRSFQLKRFWHALFGRELLRGAASFIATSQQEERELVADGFPSEKVSVRYNGLDLQEYDQLPARGSFRHARGISSHERVVLFLGRIIPRKGVDLLISAFAAACRERGRLVVAGPEGERGYLNTLRELARRCGVQERTLFTGPLYEEQKRAALVDSDVFVLPSRYENFANSVAESIACGTPVIVTRNCGVSEFVEGRVGFVIPREQAALTHALQSLLDDDTLLSQFRAGCRAVAETLDWNRQVGLMENLYERLRRNRERN